MRLNGILILVVGPSGVGKDTLLEGARSRLAGRSDIVFHPREVVRRNGVGSSNEINITPELFKSKQHHHLYSLTWHAHGTSYGVGIDLEDELARGRIVVVNASRQVVSEVRRRFDRVGIISIRAPRQALEQRLRARGREASSEIIARLRRADELAPSGPDVLVIDNSGTIADGVEALIAAINNIGCQSSKSILPPN